jgi:hypothetical protein
MPEHGSRRLGLSRNYNDACFIVRDHSGQALAYVYLEAVLMSAFGGKADITQTSENVRY